MCVSDDYLVGLAPGDNYDGKDYKVINRCGCCASAQETENIPQPDFCDYTALPCDVGTYVCGKGTKRNRGRRLSSRGGKNAARRLGKGKGGAGLKVEVCIDDGTGGTDVVCTEPFDNTYEGLVTGCGETCM